MVDMNQRPRKRVFSCVAIYKAPISFKVNLDKTIEGEFHGFTAKAIVYQPRIISDLF